MIVLTDKKLNTDCLKEIEVINISKVNDLEKYIKI